jgi:hypothetical protein
MLNWLKHGKINFKPPPSIILPDPRESSDNVEGCNIAAANEFVDEVQRSKDVLSPAGTSTPKKRKREEYGQYSPDTRAKMARYCIDNGPSKTARFFSKKT